MKLLWRLVSEQENVTPRALQREADTDAVSDGADAPSVSTLLEGGWTPLCRRLTAPPVAPARWTPSSCSLEGLSNATHLNGKRGQAIRYDVAKQRWQVNVDTENILVRPENVSWDFDC